MEFTVAEREIQSAALDFARKNKKDIAKKLTDKSRFLPEDESVSVFMAGSPMLFTFILVDSIFILIV
ncbi:MAG: hypothetical protein ACNYZG_00265 [Gammaproteobacteria bacterium]